MIFRRATLNDFAEISSIGDVYGGLDYFPMLFEKYVLDPSHYAFVGEVNGRIVAFKYYHVVDDGGSIVGGGLRTHPEFRGQGVARNLGEYCAHFIMQDRPNVFDNYLITAFDTEFQRKELERNPENITLLSRRALLSLRIPAQTLKSCLATINNANPTTVERPGLASLLDETIHSPSTKLFPDQYMVVSWEPYGIMESNLREIYSEHSIVWSREAPLSKPSMLSVRTAYPCQIGVAIDVDIYGIDNDGCASHVRDALRYLLDRYPDHEGEIAVQIFTPLDVNVDLLNMPWKPGPMADHKTYILLKKNISNTGRHPAGIQQEELHRRNLHQSGCIGAIVLGVNSRTSVDKRRFVATDLFTSNYVSDTTQDA
ncbi:hypothetical protein CAPTEDRAFT_221060 [Capitella teleta]|uniref:N-acetyltransferase domain-containing protein n=1 Tax=Capitella teleta TaxID=283909 RepID=R7T7S4_CAPTE|nr:hypothetical protein CAPTEDRAFT_221060 [Capitella teleta]|eukprot:ELT87049.1 hypothetical protein CAPTEDRAFT_221060 [Capitella teleta]